MVGMRNEYILSVNRKGGPHLEDIDIDGDNIKILCKE
jgi:hypothetical protein